MECYSFKKKPNCKYIPYFSKSHKSVQNFEENLNDIIKYSNRFFYNTFTIS